MTVLRVKEIVDFDKYNDELSPLEMFSDEGASIEHVLKVLKICQSFEEAAENSKSTVLRSISEEDFVRLARTAQNAVLMAMVSQKKGMSLLRSHANGDLQGYTHTVVLAVIGVLHNEGVL